MIPKNRRFPAKMGGLESLSLRLFHIYIGREAMKSLETGG